MRTILSCRALTIAGTLLLAGCAASVVDQSPEGIWFREPFIGNGDMAEQASRHCAKYGKAGIYAGTLDPIKGYALPVVAYDCR